MTFEEVLDRVLDMLQRRGRVSYRALQRQFDLDEAYLEDVKTEILYAHPQVVDDEGRGLTWLGDTASASTSPAPEPVHAPLAYTPPHLAEKILTSRTALEGERKQVTVLFADIKDSTELIKDLDPEAAQQLLDPAIHIMMDAVHRFEGTVNRVLGDGIMALFGAPIAHEDHALRACYAALALQAAMQPYAEDIRRRHLDLLKRYAQVDDYDFALSYDDTRIIGTTPTGRATAQALRMNDDLIVAARERWVEGGWWPPAD